MHIYFKAKAITIPLGEDCVIAYIWALWMKYYLLTHVTVTKNHHTKQAKFLICFPDYLWKGTCHTWLPGNWSILGTKWMKIHLLFDFVYHYGMEWVCRFVSFLLERYCFHPALSTFISNPISIIQIIYITWEILYFLLGFLELDI